MGRGREGGDAHSPASTVVGDTWKLCISGMTLIYTIALFFVIGCVALWAWARMYFQQKRTKRFSVGFFHPYCNAGGGGERVLWCAILGIQQRYQNEVSILVYTGDDVQTQEMINKVKTTFAIEFPYPDNIEFVYLSKRWLVEAERYPYFTMLGQSIASMVMGWEAVSKITPHVMLDTMGYAFTYPLFRLAGCRVGCYVHYPTISSDMLHAVAEQRDSVNNRGGRTSTLKRFSKLGYYWIFAFLYKLVGRFSSVVMVNSTWTANHIREIWGIEVQIVYPPCDTTRFTAIPLNWSSRVPIILSIAQFRPEKDHAKQIEALSKLFEKYPQHKEQNTKLVLVGSARNEGDRQRIEDLKLLSRKLGVESSVVFEVGVSIERLTELLSTAMIGIHTMWNEHFGIGVVELSAAGVIPVAHNSAGPKEDIVLPGKTGFLASSASDYAQFIHQILEEKGGDGEGEGGRGRERERSEGVQREGRKYVEEGAGGGREGWEGMQEGGGGGRERWEEMQREGRRYVEERFSQETFMRRWEEVVRGLFVVKK